MTTSPVIVDMPASGITATMADGAYYVARNEAAQVVIIGAMHFTPGEYIDALNELADTHFELHESSFMLGRDKLPHDREVLRRGFVSLIAKKA